MVANLLNKNELATVLSGLRALQRYYAMNVDELGSKTLQYFFPEHFVDCTPLTSIQIDALCERLNMGKPEIERRSHLRCLSKHAEPVLQSKCNSEPTSYDRASWALKAIETFADQTGLDIDPDGDGIETAMGDLLGDLMHLCKELDIDFYDMLHKGEGYFSFETQEAPADEQAESV